MNIVVIGGVAAGTKTAAKLMRQDRSAKVTVYTKGSDISYAGCGLPYYVGGSIETREELIVNTPEAYMGLTGVAVRTGMEATAVDAAVKTVTQRSLQYALCFIDRLYGLTRRNAVKKLHNIIMLTQSQLSTDNRKYKA